MLEIPLHFMQVRYNASCLPGIAQGLRAGANCQHFAYELLRYFGLRLPDFRSSELWKDRVYTNQVKELRPLDLLLWNKTPEAWGAHVGVYLGDNQAIHLSKAIGVASIWKLEEFQKHNQYACSIGAKRVKNKSVDYSHEQQ
jgi:murein DD-endopeptidase / murein LD-carboxypeptidase